MSFTWIGWPGKHVSGCHFTSCQSFSVADTDVQIPEADRDLVNKRLLDEYQCYPVYLADELADRHYNGTHTVRHTARC